MPGESKAGAKITLYVMGEMMGSINRHEGTYIKHGLEDYAQYKQARFLHIKPKGKQNGLCFRATFQPTILVLTGWGHPMPASFLGDPVPGNTPGITVRASRYASFDPRWVLDFNDLINPYIAKSPELVFLDWREITAGNPTLTENNEQKDLHAVETPSNKPISSSIMKDTLVAPGIVTAPKSSDSDLEKLQAAVSSLKQTEATAPAAPKEAPRKWMSRKEWIKQQAEKVEERKVTTITLEETGGELQLRFPGKIEKPVSEILRPHFTFAPNFWKDPVWTAPANRANLILAAKLTKVAGGVVNIEAARVTEIAAIV